MEGVDRGQRCLPGAGDPRWVPTLQARFEMGARRRSGIIRMHGALTAVNAAQLHGLRGETADRTHGTVRVLFMDCGPGRPPSRDIRHRPAC